MPGGPGGVRCSGSPLLFRAGTLTGFAGFRIILSSGSRLIIFGPGTAQAPLHVIPVFGFFLLSLRRNRLLLTEDNGDQNADFIENQHGHSHKQLGNHIRRRQDGCHDEDDQHGIPARSAHALGRDHAHA